jgi:cytosine/uracil/thiamine/allantoin permease
LYSEHKTKYQKGWCRVTTHRIIWQGNVGCIAVGLDKVANLQVVVSFIVVIVVFVFSLWFFDCVC